jgi:hypothetical protein
MWSTRCERGLVAQVGIQVVGRTRLQKLTDYNTLFRYPFIPFHLSTIPLMPTRSVPSPSRLRVLSQERM